MRIEKMDITEIKSYAELFISAFNDEPWNDNWTMEIALIRIENMMATKTFIGKALYDGDELIGLIWGQKEQFYDGVHFQIQEFCIKNNRQGQGIGTKLLDELTKSLKEENITNVFLLTSKGVRTEGYYQSKGFTVSDCMIFMGRKL